MLYKYPKTMHLPWSPGLQNDDRLIESLDGFLNQEVVVTIKMDGENTTMYKDHIHARSLDSNVHPSRHWVRALHGQIKHNIPDGWRICGENLYAEHSIRYENLSSYFYVFSIWYEDTCLDWDLTCVLCEEWGLQTVPVIERGYWDESWIKNHMVNEYLKNGNHDGDPMEGYVVRVADAFDMKDFHTKVAKYVRKNHIQTDQHWMEKPVVRNGLKAAA